MSLIRNIGLLMFAIAPMASVAQVTKPLKQPPLNEEHLEILRQGKVAWSKWREENPETRPELSEADLREVDLSELDLSESLLLNANLSGANLRAADLSGAFLMEANLSGANLSRAILLDANLREANLVTANLALADLRGTYLVGANLTNTILGSRSLPYASNLIGAIGLDTLRAPKLDREYGNPNIHSYDIGPLVRLRADAREGGYRDIERNLTCSIERIRNCDPKRTWYARLFYFVAFDCTASYGATPQKPFWILLWMFFLGGFIHMGLLILPGGGSLFVDFRLKYKDQYATIRLDWTPNGIYPKMSPLPSRPNRYPRVFPNRYLSKFKRGASSKPRILLRLIGRVVRIGMYFSLLSTFNIGYREFNVGSWIGRIQKRQYTLRARGWLRVVSGAQSLLGVYLLALWILCTFGQPFG